MGEKHVVKLGLHMVEDGEKVLTEFQMIVLKNKTKKRGDKEKLEIVLCLHSLQFNALEIKTKGLGSKIRDVWGEPNLELECQSVGSQYLFRPLTATITMPYYNARSFDQNQRKRKCKMHGLAMMMTL